MLGKEIEIEEIKEDSHKVRAMKVIENIHAVIKERKEKVKEAEDKLEEILNKEIENISEEDGQSWNWE